MAHDHISDKDPESNFSTDTRNIKTSNDAGESQLPDSSYTSTILPSGVQEIPLGSGVIKSCLGRGGMAQVYKIWNSKLNVYRAVKLFLPLNDATKLKRFQAEAQITAQLQHGNITQVYDVGKWKYDLPYIEMEYIKGHTLQFLIKTFGALPEAVACAISIHIADALSYAHKKRVLIDKSVYDHIIHRDLKPANVMLTNEGRVKVVDFGIARPAAVSLHTTEGCLVGTLSYLGPEYFKGEPIDERSDIYALGEVMYELSTGIMMFNPELLDELIKMKTNELFHDSYQKLNTFKRSINHNFVHIIEKCLSFNKSKRYENAEIVKNELLKVLKTLTSSTSEQILQDFAQKYEFLFTTSVHDTIKTVEKNITKNYPITKKPKTIDPITKTLMLGGIIAIVFIVTLWIVSSTFFSNRTLIDSNPPVTQKNEELQPPLKNPAHNQNNSQVMSSSHTTSLKPDQRNQMSDTSKHRTDSISIARTKKNKRVNTVSMLDSPKEGVGQAYSRKDKELSGKITSKSSENDIQIGNEKEFLDELKKKYSQENPLDIAEKACRSNAFDDAIQALLVPDSTLLHSELRALLLVWAYVETHQYHLARSLDNHLPSSDGYSNFLRGKIQQSIGAFDKAKDYFIAARRVKSQIKSKDAIRRDATFEIALIMDTLYKNNSSNPELKKEAENSWEILSQLYESEPNNERYRLAKQKLLELRM